MDALARHRLTLLDLDPQAIEALPVPARVRAVYRQFVRRIPYENVSNLSRRRSNPADPDAWPRGTDRLLRDARADGLGGTCFSMAYALADLFRGVGANAHTALGHHLKKEEPHAAVVVYEDDGPFLYDASYFLPEGVPVRPGGGVADAMFTYTLEPRRGPMLALVQCDAQGTRNPLFSMIPMPAPPDTFRRAWIDTFLAKPERPARISRRVGDEIRWFGEEKGHIEILAPDGRREVDPGPDLPGALARAFGVREGVLRAHFASARRADAAC